MNFSLQCNEIERSDLKNIFDCLKDRTTPEKWHLKFSHLQEVSGPENLWQVSISAGQRRKAGIWIKNGFLRWVISSMTWALISYSDEMVKVHQENRNNFLLLLFESNSLLKSEKRLEAWTKSWSFLGRWNTSVGYRSIKEILKDCVEVVRKSCCKMFPIVQKSDTELDVT